MLKHLVVDSYGVYLGLKSARLVVKKDGVLLKEYPLKNLKTISIKSRGVGLSSDLAYACGVRGVKILKYFLLNIYIKYVINIFITIIGVEKFIK